MNGQFILGDCMDYLPQFEDNHFDLAIVDPPYGKKPTRDNPGRGGFNSQLNYDNKANKWDVAPSNEYFMQLFRVSQNQIIWGANYFVEFLRSSNCFICWNKMNGENIFSDFELAYTSFTSRARMIKQFSVKSNRFHPTQKPIALYKWLLKNYAKEGDLILDTHVGSASSLIACEDMGFKYVGYELDEDYYNSAMKRVKNHVSQLKMF